MTTSAYGTVEMGGAGSESQKLIDTSRDGYRDIDSGGDAAAGALSPISAAHAKLQAKHSLTLPKGAKRLGKGKRNMPRMSTKIRKGHFELENDMKQLHGLIDFMEILRWCVVPTYTVIILGCVVTLILGLTSVLGQVAAFFIVLAANAVVSVVSAYVTYKIGTLDGQIKRAKQEVDQYSSELDQLGLSVKGLKSQNDWLIGNTKQLEADVDELGSRLAQFDDLKNQLEKIVGESGGVFEKVREMNSMIDEMNRLALVNMRASYLRIYYDVVFRDDDPTMDLREYRRFLGRLSGKHVGQWKAKYKSFRAIDEDGNGSIDVSEFRKALDAFLVDIEDEVPLVEQADSMRSW